MSLASTGPARATLALVAAMASASAAHATFHFASIVEIYTGSAQCPTCQYVTIMAYADFQEQFASVQVTAFSRTGAPMADFAVFASNLPSTSTNQKSILASRPAATSYFGVPPNQSAAGALDAEGGVVCFRKGAFVVDCVSYGNYTGSPNVGGSPAGPPARKAPSGCALRRDFKGNSVLEASDDTNNSAVDFFVTGPRPKNFAGTVSTILSVTKSTPTLLTLTWSPTFPSHAVHRTVDPTTVHASTPIITINSPPYQYTETIGPEPFVCFVVKP